MVVGFRGGKGEWEYMIALLAKLSMVFKLMGIYGKIVVYDGSV